MSTISTSNYKLSHCRLTGINSNYHAKNLATYAAMFPDQFISFGKQDSRGGFSIAHECRTRSVGIAQKFFSCKEEMLGYVAGYLAANHQYDKIEATPIPNAYVDAQFAKIKLPNLNHIAGVMQIVGDVEGKTNWLNVSGAQFSAIRKIMVEVK